MRWLRTLFGKEELPLPKAEDGRIQVGFWKSTLEDKFPYPEDWIDFSWDLRERRLVVQYLRSHRRGDRYWGWAECRFCGEPLGYSDFGDDRFVWPEKFEHYLIYHGVKPPQIFIDHVLARSELQPQTEFGVP